MNSSASSKKVVIYTDGSCLGNPGNGGYAGILIYGEHQKIVKGSAKNTTNNQMEMLAAIKSLQAITKPCKVELYTDSSYLKDGITKWIENWQKNNWKTAAKKPVKNKELWLELLEEAKKHKINWHWVKAHAENELNNKVDALARAEAEGV